MRFHTAFEKRKDEISPYCELTIDTYIPDKVDIERIYRPILLFLIESIIDKMKEEIK